MAKVAFLQKICWDFLGTMSISATLKAAGHKCDVFIETEEKDLLQRVVDYKPDLLAFSVTTNSYPWALRQSRKIKNRYAVKTGVWGNTSHNIPGNPFRS